MFVGKDVGRDVDIHARLTFFLMILLGCCEVHVIVVGLFFELCHLLAWVCSWLFYATQVVVCATTFEFKMIFNHFCSYVAIKFSFIF